MGKYMRKTKISGELAVVDLLHSSLGGVRTRAKTLALQRLQSSAASVNAAAAPAASELDPDSCYMQLRSRRLEKPNQGVADSKRHAHKQSFGDKPEIGSRRNCPNSKPASLSSVSSLNSASVGSVSLHFSGDDDRSLEVPSSKDCGTEHTYNLCLESSFGENNLDIQQSERSTRESTPCSFVMEASTIVTPGSTTRQRSTNAASHSSQDAILRNNTLAREMEEFFLHAEQQQQRLFVEKYNFDIVNDMPLPGRYQWVQVTQ